MEATTGKEAKAVARYVRIAPRKARIVIDLIRGQSVREAKAMLKFVPKRGTEPITKVLDSAIANATHNYDMDEDSLYVAEAYVDQGPTMKRWQARARGQAFPIKKKTSHITIVVREREEG